MFDTFPGVGDWTADKLTLNYKHFVQCQRQMKDLLFSLQSNSASTKIYMVQNYFICCAGNINERMYMHVYTSCVHFYGRDQLTEQYSLLGGEYHWSGKQESMFQCCQEAKQAWCDISIVCAMGRFFQSQVRQQRNGEMSFSLSLTRLRRRLYLNFRRIRWKQSRD